MAKVFSVQEVDEAIVWAKMVKRNIPALTVGNDEKYLDALIYAVENSPQPAVDVEKEPFLSYVSQHHVIRNFHESVVKAGEMNMEEGEPNHDVTISCADAAVILSLLPLLPPKESK